MLHNPWLRRPEDFEGKPLTETGLHGGLAALANRLLGRSYESGTGYGSCTVIGSEHVLKVAPYPSHRGRFDHDKAIAGLELPGVQVPKIVDEGIEEDHEWVLIERVNGRPAYEVWNSLSDSARHGLMEQVVECVRVMQRFVPDLLLLHSGFDDWQRHVLGAVDRAFERAAGVLPDSVFAAAKEARDRWAASLSDEPGTVTCHGDLWFGNLLIDDTGRLVAIIDWDRLAVAPPEYELDMIWRFWRYPWDFVPPDYTDQFADQLDAHLLQGLVSACGSGMSAQQVNLRLSMLELAYRVGVTAGFGWSDKHERMIANVLDGNWAGSLVEPIA